MKLNLIYKTLWTGAGSGLLIPLLEKPNLFHLTGPITLVLYWYENWWVCSNWCPNWIEALKFSLLLKLPRTSFFLLRLLCISINLPYSLHAPNCNLKLLDKLQKQICRTVGPSRAASLEPLAHCQNVASLSLFYRYYFHRCSSELAQLVPLPCSQGRLTCYSDRLYYLSVTIPWCYKDVYTNSFFPHTARLWNYLPTEYFLWPMILMALSLKLTDIF